jgi:hypothetical protein
LEENPQYGIPINSHLLLATAKKFQLYFENRNDVDESYVERWRQRHSIGSYLISGSSSDADSKALEKWIRNIFPLISKSFDSKNIYNMDETALFWKALPHRSFHTKGGRKKGVKEGKDRITIALTVSMSGEKMKPVVIGRSSHPASFKLHVIQFPFKYYFSKNAWMTNSIFLQYLKTLDQHFIQERRKVAIIVDNCASHNIDKSALKNITLYYLPPNTTSVGQPLDAGVVLLL